MNGSVHQSNSEKNWKCVTLNLFPAGSNLLTHEMKWSALELEFIFNSSENINYGAIFQQRMIYFLMSLFYLTERHLKTYNQHFLQQSQCCKYAAYQAFWEIL